MNRRRLLIPALLLLPFLALVSCGGDGDGTGPAEPTVSSLVKVEGDGQTAEVGSRLGTDPVVQVNDQDGNPLSGIQVSFVASGGGSVTASSATTGSDGRASTGWTLGTDASASQTLRANASGVSATFSATATPGAPVGLERDSGSAQIGEAQSVLPEPLVVRVVDEFGNGVPDVAVTFSASAGTVSPEETQTDGQGRARTTVTLPPLSEADGPLDVTPRSLDRARITLAYEQALRAFRTISVTATGPGVGAVDFSPRVEGSTDATWTLVSGMLPPGIDFSSSGVLSGTPQQTGEFDLTVRVDAEESVESEQPYLLKVCEEPVEMTTGESRILDAPPASECGLFLPSGDNGDRYRVALLWPAAESTDPGSEEASLIVNADRSGSAAPLTTVRPTASRSAARGFRIPFHRIRDDLRRLRVRKRVHSRLLMEGREMTRRLGPEARLPDLSARAAVSGPARSPESRDFRDAVNSCNTAERGTVETTLIAENEHVAIYQEDAQRADDPVSAATVQPMLDYYANHGKQVIDDYFGGLPDVDGNGKFFVVIAPFDSSITSDAAAFVLSIDTFSSERCPASNEAEVTYFSADVVQALTGESPTFQALGTLVHEAKHIVSLYNRDAFGSFHPVWVEEGTAEIATEVSSRIAWEASGGPSRDARVTRQDFQDGGGFNAENWGVILRMARVTFTLASQPNALTNDPTQARAEHDFYGSSWHFHRFLADGYFSDDPAGFFRDQNAAGSPPGTDFLEQATGQNMETLLEEYAVASMVNGMSQVAQAGPDHTFAGYDFTTATGIFCFPNPVGDYPWPITTTGTRSQGNCSEGGFGEEDFDLSADFADRTYEGSTGRGGLRVHDFLSDGRGQGIELNVSTTASRLRMAVVRIR